LSSRVKFKFAIGSLHCDWYGGNPTNYPRVKAPVLSAMLNDSNKQKPAGLKKKL
jgi:hypothetical protein